MTVEIRIIGSPTEMAEAEKLLRDRFVIHRVRRYPSKRSDDRMAYIRASARKERTDGEAMEVPAEISKLRIRLRDLGDVNNVFLCYNFKLDRYLDVETASRLNRAIQDALREIVDEDLENVDGRLDQTFKRSSDRIIVYRSPGSGWNTVRTSDLEGGELD